MAIFPLCHRSAAEPALLVRPRLAEQRSHVRPVVTGGELLPPERQEDHGHPPAAGGRTPRAAGSQRPTTQDGRPAVSDAAQHPAPRGGQALLVYA